MQLRRWVLPTFFWLASLGAAFLAGAFAHKYREAIRAKVRSIQSSPVIQTSLYNLRIEKLSIPGDGRDGAIDLFGEGLLLVNRRGQSWYITKDRTLQPLSLRVPINTPDFESDPFNRTTTEQNRFSVKDILVQSLPSGVRIIASHFYWYRDRSCHTLRVSAIETTRDAVLSGKDSSGTWETLLESHCRKLNLSPDSSHHVTLGPGGRLAALSDRQILVTSGEFFGDEFAGPEAAQRGDSSGKTVLIDMGAGTATEFTRGHRNPQGLAVGPDGRIWLTELGARGGDELNLLVKGRDYGHPHLTYGTQYEMMVWPRSKTQGKHDGYEKPAFAWISSIAPSQLIVVNGKSFPWWTGDLLIAALGSESLYRVRIEGDRAMFVEPIVINHRIRDMVETTTGTIVLKTDDDFVVFIDNLETAPASGLDPVTRGGILAGQCRSCHALEPKVPSGLGPNLWGVVNRRVASAPNYSYSDALKKLGGTWTPDRIRAFITAPGTVAPGTRMAIAATYTEEQMNDLIAYLQSLR